MVHFFGGVLCTGVDRNRAPRLGFVLWVSGGSGVRGFEARDVWANGCDVQSVVRY